MSSHQHAVNHAIAARIASGLTTAEALASHFGLSVRTIYRRIARLRDAGFPIRGEPGVGYIMRPGRSVGGNP